MATFGQKIKAIRLKRNMSQEDLAKILNTTKQTISRYETGINSPRLDSVADISDKLGIDMSLLINQRFGVDDVLNYERGAQIELIGQSLTPNLLQIVNSCNKLNNEGQRRVMYYASDLEATGLYNRNEAMYFEKYSELYTIGTAAAGNGIINHDNESYRIFMTTEIPPHDFAVDVRGDSMFPTIYDGDVVFVKKNFETRDNQIYVLTVEDETVVKRVVFENHHLTLISDNPDWPDRVISEQDNDSVRIEGIVVGWETPS